jgi:hypothetical protein
MLRGGQIIEQSAYSKVCLPFVTIPVFSPQLSLKLIKHLLLLVAWFSDQVMEERDSPLYSLINGLGKQVDSSPVTPSNENSDGSTTAVEDELDVDQLGEKVDGKRRFSVSSLKKATMLFVFLSPSDFYTSSRFHFHDCSTLTTRYIVHLHRSDSESKYQAIRDLKLSTKPREKMEQGQVKVRSDPSAPSPPSVLSSSSRFYRTADAPSILFHIPDAHLPKLHLLRLDNRRRYLPYRHLRRPRFESRREPRPSSMG